MHQVEFHAKKSTGVTPEVTLRSTLRAGDEVWKTGDPPGGIKAISPQVKTRLSVVPRNGLMSFKLKMKQPTSWSTFLSKQTTSLWRFNLCTEDGYYYVKRDHVISWIKKRTTKEKKIVPRDMRVSESRVEVHPVPLSYPVVCLSVPSLRSEHHRTTPCGVIYAINNRTCIRDRIVSEQD